MARTEPRVCRACVAIERPLEARSEQKPASLECRTAGGRSSGVEITEGPNLWLPTDGWRWAHGSLHYPYLRTDVLTCLFAD